MENKIEDIILINDYLTNCKLDDPYSKRSELTRELLNHRVREVLELKSKSNKKSKSKSIFKSLLSLIF